MSKYMSLPTYQDGLNKAMLAMTLDVVAETKYPSLIAESAAAVVLNEIKMPDGVALYVQADPGMVLITCIHAKGDTQRDSVPAWAYVPEAGVRLARPLFDTLLESISSICDMSQQLLHGSSPTVSNPEMETHDER